MPEPFKNLLSKTVITGMGKHFARAWPEFDRAAFIAAATKNLNALELKERSVQITSTMATFLPDDFHRAAAIMLAALAPDDWDDAGNPEVDDRGIVGWAVMPMTHYVGLYGLKHFPLSMTLLKEMTKRSSSEFGIRFFLLEEPKRTLSTLEKWTRDSNHHVRRLVSEGTRPRLPCNCQPLSKTLHQSFHCWKCSRMTKKNMSAAPSPTISTISPRIIRTGLRR